MSRTSSGFALIRLVYQDDSGDVVIDSFRPGLLPEHSGTLQCNGRKVGRVVRDGAHCTVDIDLSLCRTENRVTTDDNEGAK